MSIEKPDFDNLIKEHIPYTVTPNYVTQNVRDTTALAIWCYLISLPENWIVNKAHLMNHFDIGRDKLDKAMKFLIDNFLITYHWHKKPNGTVDKVSIVVKNGKDFYKNIVLNQLDDSTTLKTRIVDKSTTLKNHSVEKPLSGKTAPTKEIINTKFLKEENKNKSFCKNEEQKENRLVDNSKRHDFADSMDRNASEKRVLQKHDEVKKYEKEILRAPMPDALRELIRGISGKKKRVEAF